MDLAAKITETCYRMYSGQKTGLAPEFVRFSSSGMAVGAGHNLLRPEAVEAIYYMWRFTKDPKYREWGGRIFLAFEEHCKVATGGYAGLKNVNSAGGAKDDTMQTFWLAETLKYLLLLFSDDDALDLDKFTINTEALAEQAVAAIEAETFTTGEIERKQTRRYPSPPFTTSTMQQEASRKLYFGARKTMQVAQSLYEGVRIGGENVGLITYMRTDGVQMAREAVAASRNVIQETYSSKYLPDSPRIYKSKAKNAQEAHEAIRPTDVRRTPDSLERHLSPDQLKLYTLIWKRTVASQMEAAVLDQVGVDITSADRKIAFRATGSVIAFDGFIKVYREGRDDGSDDDDNSRILPKLEENERQERTETLPEQHFTQPPPRYSEASLVKKLEELGTSIFCELGPHTQLTGMGRGCLPAGFGCWLPSLNRKQENKFIRKD